MLIIAQKPGSGTVHSGDGIFDFGKTLLKKALNSNLIKKASKAINSDLGKQVIKAAAESELGQEAISRAKKRVREVSDAIPEPIKKVARSKLGQQVQKKIISEIKPVSEELGLPVDKLAQSAFDKLGISKPKRKRRRKRGRGFVYPQQLVSQFGAGIVLE